MKQVYQAKESVESLNAKSLLSTAAIGAMTGVVIWILSYVLREYVIGRIACQMDTSIVSCESAGNVAANIAIILAGIAGLMVLVRQRAFRPLLVVLASTATLWGVTATWLAEVHIVDFLLVVVASALVYTVFAWFALLRSFAISAIVTVVLVVLFRVIITQ